MTTLIRKLAVIAGLGLALGSAVYVPPAAAREVIVQVGVAPPPPRFERVPPPRAGWVWAPGYWAWRGPRAGHVWIGGHWERVRRGYVYRPAGWVHYGNGWRFREGYWGR
jgi:hypothetical protein